MNVAIVKNIAKKVFNLQDGHDSLPIHNRKYIVADRWDCSIGSRNEELYLYRWSSEKGFVMVELPTITRAVRAYGYDRQGEVSYYDSKVLASLDKGYYILIYVEDVPTWEDSDREDWTSYDVFEVQ